MKRFSLFGVSAVLAAAIVSSPAQASAVWFDFQGSVAMLDSSGPVETVSSLTGNIVWNYETGTGTAYFASPDTFVGAVWNFHDISLVATRVGVAHADMLVDWGVIQNIHVTADFGMTPYSGPLGGGYDLITLDGDHDGVMGNAMDNGPFSGLNVFFSGNVSGVCMLPELYSCVGPATPPQIAPVPLLPAMWLLFSGLVGLAGFRRLARK